MTDNNWEKKLAELLSRMDDLESRIRSLEERTSKQEAETRPPQSASQTTPPGQYQPPPLSPQYPKPPQPYAPPPQPPYTPPAKPPRPAQPKQKTGGDFEKKLGVWLARVGVVLVFLAAAFFLKLALDYLGDAAKVAVGVIVGMLLLSGGEFSERKQYRALARSLTGGGLAVLYVTVFAAFAFYDLIGNVPAFVFMLLVTGAGTALSLRYNSQVIIIIALLGGFLTPVLVSTGVDKQIILMSYMIVLNLALIGISYRKKWRSVTLLCFFSTLVLFLGWSVEYYSGSRFIPTLLFATAFFLIFALSHVLHCFSRQRKAKWEDLTLITANAVIYFGGMWGLLELEDHDAYLGLLPISLAVVFFIQLRAAMYYNRADNYLQYFLSGLAVGFLSMAIPLQLNYEIVTVVWAVEAAALMGYSLYSRNGFLRYLGLGVFFLALFHLPIDVHVYQDHLRDDNIARLFLGIFASYGSVLAAIGAAVYFFKRFQGRTPLHRAWHLAFYLTEVVLGLVFLLVLNSYMFEANAYPRFLYSRADRGMVLNISLIFTIYGSVSILLGILYGVGWLRYFGLGTLCMALLKVVLYDLAGLEMGYRVVSFLVLGGLLIGLSFLYQKYRHKIEGLALSDNRADKTTPENKTEA